MTGRKVDLENSFIKSLRRANQLQCQLEGCSGKFADSEERVKQHFSTTHQDILESKKTTLSQLIGDCRKFNQNEARGNDRGFVLFFILFILSSSPLTNQLMLLKEPTKLGNYYKRCFRPRNQGS